MFFYQFMNSRGIGLSFEPKLSPVISDCAVYSFLDHSISKLSVPFTLFPSIVTFLYLPVLFPQNFAFYALVGVA